jgi:hypothetical protein
VEYKNRDRVVSRLQWDTYLSKMPEKHFFTLFRMDYRTFNHVLDMTEHDM